VGWSGSYDKWFQCLDLLMQLDPQVIVPGHGPLCGMEGARKMKAYLRYVRDESKKCFDAGLTSLDAAKRIEFGPYGEWRAPARLYLNVERAYREFRNEPPDAPWNSAAQQKRTFDVLQNADIFTRYEHGVSILLQQLRQPREVHRHPPGLVALQHASIVGPFPDCPGNKTNRQSGR
jgi:hypothetical protein